MSWLKDEAGVQSYLSWASTWVNFGVPGSSSKLAYLHFDHGSLRFPPPLGFGCLRPCCSPEDSGRTERFPRHFRGFCHASHSASLGYNLLSSRKRLPGCETRETAGAGCFGGQTLGSNRGQRGWAEAAGGRGKRASPGWKCSDVPELKELLLHRWKTHGEMDHADQCWWNQITLRNIRLSTRSSVKHLVRFFKIVIGAM